MDWDQLHKDTPELGNSICQPIRFQGAPNNTNYVDDPDAEAVVPCGLLPWSYFNDTFEVEIKPFSTVAPS